MATSPIVIASIARTPMGSMLGDFSSLAAHQLGSVAIQAAVERAGVQPDVIDAVIMGNCLMAGQGQAPARQAALAAGLPYSAGATTISKMCGAGMQATMFAADTIRAGSADVMVAGGMESMTNAPHLLTKARSGYRIGHGELKDHMMLDGLEDAYQPGMPMGKYADQTALDCKIDRAAQDNYAIESLMRARRANEDGSFAGETVPVTVKSRAGETVVSRDQQPFKSDPDKIPNLRPAFNQDGTVTAANASSISDGAAALVLMSEAEAEKRGITPLARITGQVTHSQEPAKFCTAPGEAISKLLAKTGWSTGDVDIWEINEAFAVVALAAMQTHGLSHDNVNVNGGACALGHPIGASGARIIVTLLAAMAAHDLKRGVASLCIGGGEATAMGFERI